MMDVKNKLVWETPSCNSLDAHVGPGGRLCVNHYVQYCYTTPSYTLEKRKRKGKALRWTLRLPYK